MLNANEILSPIVGQSERKIKELFDHVRKTGGIIFIDEIDSLPNRNSTGGYMNSILN
jgi:SpoVK/Ycf46/Vps4 family AAA+-type ATPase